MRCLRNLVSLLMLGILLLMIVLCVPKCCGYEIYAVASGSMEPEIRVGEAVYVKPCGFENLQEGDVITYSLDQGNTLVTHRVVKIDREKRVLRTKGDANETSDVKWIEAEAVLGRVVFHIRYLGIISYLLSSRSGKLYVCAVLLWLLALQLILDKYSMDGKKKGDELRLNINV